MPIEFSISTDLDLAYARWSGVIDIVEFREMFASYVQDENYLMGRRELCDFSQVIDMDAGFQQVWSALSLVNNTEKTLEQKTRCVIFAPGDTAFGFARMYQSLADYEGGVHITVCRKEGEALRALDVDAPSIEALLAQGNFQKPEPKEDMLA